MSIPYPRRTRPRPSRWRPALLGAFALAGVVALNGISGPGFDPDSMLYVGAAESLARAGTLQVPFAEWPDADSTSAVATFPPGLALAASLPIRLGVAPARAAVGVGAAAAFVTVAILAWLVEGLAGPAAALLAALLVMLTPALIEAHLSILSEPLFLACLMLTLAAMIGWPDRPARYGILAGLASIVRYVGVALPGTAMLWAFLQPAGWRVRLRRAAVAGLPALVLQAAWLIRCRLAAVAVPISPVGLDTDLHFTLVEAREALGSWLAPGLSETSWESPVAAAVGLAVAILIIRQVQRLPWYRWPTDARMRFLAVVGIFTLCYSAVLTYARLFVGHEIPFDGRLLSPLFVLGEAVFAIVLAARWPGWNRIVRVGSGLALAAWFAGAVVFLEAETRDVRENGWDYNSFAWRQSPLIHWIRTEGARYRLYTNHPVPVFFQAGRPSWQVPTSTRSDTVAAFGKVLAARHGALIGFTDTTWSPSARPDSLARLLGLREVARFDDGTVWLPADSAAAPTTTLKPPGGPALLEQAPRMSRRNAPPQAASSRNLAPCCSRSWRSARSRSWRMRSRVTPSISPISSRVFGGSPSSPK